MTKLERKAALAVLGASAAVTVAGIKLMKRHAKYMTQKAAAFFDREEYPGSESDEKSE